MGTGKKQWKAKTYFNCGIRFSWKSPHPQRISFPNGLDACPLNRLLAREKKRFGCDIVMNNFGLQRAIYLTITRTRKQYSAGMSGCLAACKGEVAGACRPVLIKMLCSECSGCTTLHTEHNTSVPFKISVCVCGGGGGGGGGCLVSCLNCVCVCIVPLVI